MMAVTIQSSHVAPHKLFLAIPGWASEGGGAFLSFDQGGFLGFSWIFVDFSLILIIFMFWALIHVQHYITMSRMLTV